MDRTLDLEAVVDLALDGNPGLLAEKERLREVEAGVTEVRADAYPQLSFTTGWDLSRNPSLLNSADFEEFVEMFPGGSFEPRRQELFTTSTELRQPLFTWGKVGAALDLAESVVEVTEAQISAVRLDTAAEAGRAFYDLLSRKQALGALEAQEQARQEALEVVQARYDLQDATRLDLLRAQASLAQVSPSLEEARGQISVAESRLRRALGEENGDLALRLPPDRVDQECDSRLVEQVVHQLVSNAAKFTPDGGRVIVSVKAGATNRIVVGDTGLGISQTDRERLFTRFFRSHQTEVQQRQGSGLGLAIVQAVVAAHGGTVTVESELGRGSTFVVELPSRLPGTVRAMETAEPAEAAEVEVGVS